MIDGGFSQNYMPILSYKTATGWLRRSSIKVCDSVRERNPGSGISRKKHRKLWFLTCSEMDFLARILMKASSKKQRF